MSEENKNADYYVDLDWTLVFGTDLDFNGKLYHYIEIKEFPNFVYCAPTQEIALANYKKQLKLMIQIMLDSGDEMPIPGEDEDDIDWEALCP